MESLKESTTKVLQEEIPKIAHLIVLLAPIIVPLFIFLGTIFTNFVKGFVYIGYLFSAIALRSLVYYPMVEEKGVYFCGFGTYVLAFSMGYVCFPMFSNSDAINSKVISAFVITISLYFFAKYFSPDCQINAESFINLFVGFFYGCLIGYLMTIGGSSAYLFLSELSSREYCSMPTSQKFKCSVYQGGQLITTYQQ